MRPDLVLQSDRVVTPDGVRPAAVWVLDGRIAAVVPEDGGEVPAGALVLDCGRDVLMPGVVDTHVHVNEPGRTEWEGFATATRAAAAGGVTTLVDMPLNSIPATTSREGLRAKRAATAGRLRVDVGFWGGVVPGNATELSGLLADGALGFKAFLVPSGVDEFEHVGEADLRAAMAVLAAQGVPLLVHAERPPHRRGGRGLGRGRSPWVACVARPRSLAALAAGRGGGRGRGAARAALPRDRLPGARRPRRLRRGAAGAAAGAGRGAADHRRDLPALPDVRGRGDPRRRRRLEVRAADPLAGEPGAAVGGAARGGARPRRHATTPPARRR